MLESDEAIGEPRDDDRGGSLSSSLKPPRQPLLSRISLMFTGKPWDTSAWRADVSRTISSVRAFPSCMYVVFGVKILESFAYFSTSLNMTLYLSDEFGFSDTDAGWFYGTFGVLISAYGFFTGLVIDMLGVRRSVLFGSLVAFFGRLLFALTTTKAGLYISGFLVIPVGMSMVIPVLTIAVKRYSTTTNKSLAFGLYYTVMNVAALAAGPVTDIMNASIPEDGASFFGRNLSSFRWLFLIGSIANVVQVGVAWWLQDIDVTAAPRRSVVMGSPDVAVQTFDPMKQGQLRKSDSVALARLNNKSSSKHTFAARMREVCVDKRFRRLLVLSFILVAAKMVFRHLDATLPKWMQREISPDAKYGSIYAINPAIIIALVPVISACTKHWDSYNMIMYGSLLSAVSVFWLCMEAQYWTAAMFVTTLSLGEAFYSPKTYEYMMDLAPKGREGLFTNLSSAPMFITKMFAGGLSGYLLEEYCPAEGERECWKLWFVVGIISMTTPFLLCCCRGYIEGNAKSSLINTVPVVEMAQSSAEMEQQPSNTDSIDTIDIEDGPDAATVEGRKQGRKKSRRHLRLDDDEDQ